MSHKLISLSRNLLFLVPHFLVIGDDIEDFTLDKERSPAITTYPDWPISGKFRPYLFDEQAMALTIMDEDGELWQWFFGEETIQLLDVSDPTPGGRFGAASAYMHGKLFVFSGGPLESSIATTAFLYYQSGKARIVETPYGRRWACAAFHPSDDNKVYLFGGYIGHARLLPAFTTLPKP